MEKINNKTYICKRKASLFHFFERRSKRKHQQEGRLNTIGLNHGKPFARIYCLVDVNGSHNLLNSWTIITRIFLGPGDLTLNRYM